MIGSFMGLTFTVSSQKVLTPDQLKGSSGSQWAVHNRTGAKAKSQWIAPNLRSYSLQLQLRAQDGVNPRWTLEVLQEAAESPRADYFIIGGKPLSNLPFRIISLSDSWDVVMTEGILTSCSVELNIEEYV